MPLAMVTIAIMTDIELLPAALQESLASELAARMNAMSTASDNASQLKKSLLNSYNRARQTQITTGIMEIVGGANA